MKGFAGVAGILLDRLGRAFGAFSNRGQQDGVLRQCLFYRQIKQLTFSHEIMGNYDKAEETKDEIVTQVCVSEIEDVSPMFSFYDTFNN